MKFRYPDLKFKFFFTLTLTSMRKCSFGTQAQIFYCVFRFSQRSIQILCQMVDQGLFYYPFETGLMEVWFKHCVLPAAGAPVTIQFSEGFPQGPCTGSDLPTILILSVYTDFSSLKFSKNKNFLP